MTTSGRLVVVGALLLLAAPPKALAGPLAAVRSAITLDERQANGGSMSNGGAAVVGGMLFVNSGYSHHGGILPGNVLLAFSVE